MNLVKRLVLKYLTWRNERFRRRIDRVYFKQDKKGYRYIDGIVIVRDMEAVPDKSIKFPLEHSEGATPDPKTTAPDNDAGSTIGALISLK